MSLSQAQDGIAAFYLKILERQEAPQETIYGYLPDELVGLTPKMLLPKQNFSYFQGTLRNAKIMAEKKSLFRKTRSDMIACVLTVAVYECWE